MATYTTSQLNEGTPTEALFGGQTNDVSTTDADSLMKVLMIERLLKSVTEELSTLKKNLTSSDMFISQ